MTTALAPETPTGRLNACLDAYAEPLVARYFDGSSGFAGATFDTLGDNPWNRITRDDLLALTCLDEHVSPAALRWLLGDEGQAKCTEMLTGISPTVVLGRAEDVEPLAAARRARKMLLARPSIGPVKASKLLSRKRPQLVPIVDRVVERVVLAPKGQYWRTFREFMAVEQNRRLVEDLRSLSAPAEVSLLRVLDAAVWMRGSGSRSAYTVRDKVIGRSNADLLWAPRPTRKE